MASGAKPDALEALLEFLRQNRGFDFTGYKRATLVRRIDRRVQEVGVAGHPEYLDYLEVHPEEFPKLFDTILINVTSFFRDPAPWELLEKEVLPELLSRKPDGEPVRVWSAGCASGEEAYSLAMLLAEALGREAYSKRVKIYATDVDEDALAYARQAAYAARSVSGVPEPLLTRYFEHAGSRYTFDRELRRAVIFGRHDLILDAPISRVDLLLCRNTLMYFNAETQKRVLTRLHFALNDGGVLFLGKAEMLLTHRNLFTPIDLKRRIFSRVPRAAGRERLALAAELGERDEAKEDSASDGARLREAAFDASAVAQIVVDANGALALANQRARSTFGIGPRDLRRSFKDLELSYRPVELRSCIEKAYADRVVVSLKDVPRAAPGGDTFLDVQIVPLIGPAGKVQGAQISFTDVTNERRLREELKKAHTELEASYEELQSTSEELETTNEELQSTVEELETTNEELQSTNEELQTTNEELQSTNEELSTTNDELRTRGDELHDVNGYLTSILTSLEDAVVVMDRDLHVNVWSDNAEDMWGLRSDEVKGKNFLNLDIGLPVDGLRAPIRACLGDGKEPLEVTLDATNRRGRKIACRVTCVRLSDGAEPKGVILLMREAPKAAPPAH